MGRQKKLLNSWCRENEDLEIAKKKKNDIEIDVLVCKYCHMEMITDPKKKPYDRIREHLSSARHGKLKAKFWEDQELQKRQPTLYDINFRQREKEKEAEGAIHSFVRAIAYSGLSIEQADGPLGKLFRDYCPAARTMPLANQLKVKYLPEIYEKDMQKLQEDIATVKVSVIVDESPDLMGYPTVNTLLCYYSKEKKSKQICLADVSRVNACNSYTLASAVSKALESVGKSWQDVIALSSDSAEYMRKMVKDVRAAEATKILHVKDIPHLIHVTFNHAINWEGVEELRSTVIKFGALFKHANSLYKFFQETCIANGLTANSIKKPPAVVPSRWYSFFQSMTVMIEMWDCLTEVVENHTGTNAKIADLRKILANNKQDIYAKAVLIQDCMQKIIEIQEALENGKILLPEYHQLACVKLPEIFNGLVENVGTGEKAKMLLAMLPRTVSTSVKNTCREFCTLLKQKWEDTRTRNLTEKEKGLPTQLEIWRQALVLDPSKKSLCHQEFEAYTDLFTLVGEMSESLQKEFYEYMKEVVPQNPDLNNLDYWCTVSDRYPLLSEFSTSLLCLPNGSCDVERSFSKMRYVQRPDRSSMNEDTLKMMLILFINKGH